MSRLLAPLVLLVSSLVVAAPAWACGPTSMPDGFLWLGAEVEGTEARVHVEVDWQALGRDVIEEWELEQLSRAALAALADQGVRSARLLARPFAEDEALDLPLLLRLAPPLPQRPWEADRGAASAAVPGALRSHGAPGLGGAAGAGALAGKTVYLSPGHGWYWSTVLGRWASQRGNTHNIVEDFVNAEGALYYLEPLLRAAGAQVIGVRELDPNPAQRIVDDGDGGATGGAGYSETGNWANGNGKGFGNGGAPYTGATNPFALGGYRYAEAAASGTASARFVPDLPAPGLYRVAIGFTSGANRVNDARVVVRHAGGVDTFRVDQTRHGQSWWPLGTFRFRAGAHPDDGAVEVWNDTAGDPTGKVVVADVVRFGGGMGEIVRGDGAPPAAAPTTQRPRWESAARYYTQYAGAPSAVWNSSSADNNDDVTSRSRFAGWHHEPGDDAVYLSWHSNAPDPGRGTSTYVYGPNPPNGSKNFQATKGSVEFGGWLQKTLVADIRAEFDPNWKDRGLYSAYFGEVNPNHNPDMPAALVEVAFHSTKADADFLREPRFRYLLARAMTKAIIGYFAERDGKQATLPPEAPERLALAAVGNGEAQLRLRAGPTGGAAGDAPTHFAIERWNGHAFALHATVAANAQPAAADTLVSVPAPVGEAAFYRARALNAGGTSLPSAVVGVATGCPDAPKALAVQGFSRLQASQMPVENLAAWSLANVQRLRPGQMNTFDYLMRHVEDLAAAGLAVDSAERAALPDVDLATYALVDWAAGEQSTKDGVLVATERSQLAGWLDASTPRALILSGSEVGWALGPKGDPSSQDWLATWFGAAYADDDAGTYQVAPATGAALAFAGGAFDDGTAGSYDVDWPDVFALSGGTALLDYVGGIGGVAATRYEVGQARTALLGFPLETVTPPATRAALVAALVQSLGVTGVKGPCGGGGEDAGGGEDIGGVDAGGSDGSSGDAGGEDAGGSHDGVAGDGATGGSDGSGGLDGVGAQDGQLGSDATGPLPPPRDDGCGCSVRGSSRAPSTGALLWLLGCVLVLALRRRIAGLPPRT